MLWKPTRRQIIQAGGFIAAPAIIGRALAQVPMTGAGLGAPGGAAPSAKSLVLAEASGQFISKTWGSAPLDGKKVTIAFFFKFVTVPTGTRYFYSGGSNATTNCCIRFDPGTASYEFTDAFTPHYRFFSNGIAGDTTTWHHLCCQADSTPATPTMHIYMDGVEVSYSVQDAPAQNADWQATPNGIESDIGQATFALGTTMDVKLAYVYLIDGQALPPSSFTTGTGAGTTHPAAYGGTFGTNGFFLNFSGSNTNDQSGNTNNWTQNNSPTFSTDIPT